MSLINCPECGKQISDKAKSCPNCGMSINDVPDDNLITTYEDMIDDDINDSFKEADDDYLVCPNCGSRKLHIGQKGFSIGKAVAGAVAFGGIGILAGTIGSKKIKATCLECGTTATPIKESDKIKKDQELYEIMAQPMWFVLLSTLFYITAPVSMLGATFMFCSEDFLWGIVLFGIGLITWFSAKTLETKYSNKK